LSSGATRLARLIAALVITSCSIDEPEPWASRPSTTERAGRADVGGYELSWQCRGEGDPTVILDAGLDTAGMSEWFDFLPQLDALGTRVCTYDRPGTGTSDPRSRGDAPTARMQAEELHSLLRGVGIEPPIVLVPHSYAGLIARMYVDAYPGEVAGLVLEDVSTAWEIDLWLRWDDSPWIDGGQRTDIQVTERQVLDAAPLGEIPTVVVSQATYDEEGIPVWAAPIFARHQARLAALGENVIHVRADGSGHWIHRDDPAVMIAAIKAVVVAVREGEGLPVCEDVFDEERSTCY
jgi:pimeloyl-ACP methyl ester carboxylesterase